MRHYATTTKNGPMKEPFSVPKGTIFAGYVRDIEAYSNIPTSKVNLSRSFSWFGALTRIILRPILRLKTGYKPALCEVAKGIAAFGSLRYRESHALMTVQDNQMLVCGKGKKRGMSKGLYISLSHSGLNDSYTLKTGE